MLILDQKLPTRSTAAGHTLSLTAEERARSRRRVHTDEGVEAELLLARGTFLRDGDLLRCRNTCVVVRVRARPEPVLIARAGDPLLLLRAAYHLGNRHVPVALRGDGLRLAPDPVLADMLRQLGLSLHEAIEPFDPEAGAYAAHAQAHTHALLRLP